MIAELREQPEQAEKLDQIVPACAAKQRDAAGRWANLACLCGARRQEGIGYGG